MREKREKKKVTSENSQSPPSDGDGNAGFFGDDEGCTNEGEEVEDLRKEDGDAGSIWPHSFVFVWHVAQKTDCKIYIGFI